MQSTSFNLVQTVAVLQKQWKLITFFVLVTVITASITVFLVPRYFRSAAIVVSANPALADKAHLFNPNIQNLYSYFGTGDDLDRIYGIADMDTTYKKLVDEFSLIGYYQFTGSDFPVLRRKAVKALRKDLFLQKTEEGQLKIIAWTKNKQLSANLVNRMVAILQQTEADVWEKNYHQSLLSVKVSVAQMEKEYRQAGDSLLASSLSSHDLWIGKMQTLLEQIKQYRKTENEFALAGEIHPAALYVMEQASPAAEAERPDKPAIIFASLIIGFIFISIWILVNDRKNNA